MKPLPACNRPQHRNRFAQTISTSYLIHRLIFSRRKYLSVPKTIMGLTVLAFGNSIQDLIANISVSKKGLSTMAVTACFAGPIFNFGVGLGLGFWALMKTTGNDEIQVEFPTDLRTGFYFTIANCVMIVFAGTVVGKGVIGKKFGYVACALYIVYVFTSLYVSNASNKYGEGML